MEMTRTAVHVPPGEGAAVWLVGDTYTTKISGAQTGGAFALCEAVVPPGGGPPPHTHHAEDETFVVLDGEIEFKADGNVRSAAAGSVVFVPRGVSHTFSNVGGAPARMLFLYAPAGMEGMFAEIGAPAEAGVPAPPPSAEDVAKLLGAAAKYCFTVEPPAEG